MADFGSISTMSGNKTPRPEEQAQVLKLPAEEFVAGRMVGPIQSMAMYWFTIKKKDGSKTDIPFMCLDYDSATQKMVRDICPFRASGMGRLSQVFYINFLVRELQENRPRKSKLVKPSGKEKKKRVLLDNYEAYIKQFSSKTWTPYRLLRMPATLAEKAKNLSSLNIHKIKGVSTKVPITHPKYGMDVNIMHLPEAKGSAQYDIQRGDVTALTEAELNYPMQPLNTSAFHPMSLKEAKQAWKRLKKQVVKPKDEKDKDSGDDDDDDKAKKRNKKNKNKNRDKERSSKSSKSSKTSKERSSKSKDRDKSSKDKSKDKKKKKKSGQFSSKWDI